jgi:hypothetical protein
MSTDPEIVTEWAPVYAENERLLAEVERLQAENKALRRLNARKYVGWADSGGPNECSHGRAAGIDCPYCDRDLAAGSKVPGG